VRRAARRFLQTNAWPLLVIAGSTVAGCLALWWMFDGFLAGLFTGVLATSMVAMLGLIFLVVSGTTFQVSGAMGESNTADLLRAAARRKEILGWVDNLEIASGDVDHLVVTRAGIVVIDSKWHSHGLDKSRLEADAAAALASAAHARNILRAVHHRPPVVTTLVVVWGGDQDAARGQQHLGVDFVSGQELKAWLRANVTGGNAFNDSQAGALLDDLVAFKRRVQPLHRDPARMAARTTRRQQPHRAHAGA
jgi:hypothetical protein